MVKKGIGISHTHKCIVWLDGRIWRSVHTKYRMGKRLRITLKGGLLFNIFGLSSHSLWWILHTSLLSGKRYQDLEATKNFSESDYQQLGGITLLWIYM